MNGDLEEIRKKKLLQLQDEIAKQQEASEEARQLEAQKELLLKKILTPDAKSRLSTIRLANPEFAMQVELLVIQLYRMGKITRLSDAELKSILLKINLILKRN